MADPLLQSIPSGTMKQITDIAKQFYEQKIGMLKEFGDELLGRLNAPGNHIFTAEAMARRNSEAAQLPK